MTGLRVAVASGLAASAIMRRCFTGVMRELTARDGFPPLAQLSVRLEKAHIKKSAVMDALELVLLAAVAEGVARGAQGETLLGGNFINSRSERRRFAWKTENRPVDHPKATIDPYRTA
jgi:hypothetical protein